MQRLQRKAGQLLHRSPDDAQVALLLTDFESGDKLLSTIIEATRAFRQAWTDILQRSCGIAADFETLYLPIPGDPTSNAQYRPTPRDRTAKVRAFREIMTETRDVMLQEMGGSERNVIGPAKEARKHIAVYGKVIKKRQDRKLDYERYKSRAESLQGKGNRSDRENIALAKHQVDLDASQREYEIADSHLKETLPALTAAVYALLPHLVNAQIVVQNTLLGHYYTALHSFCQQYGYPIPSAEWRQVQPEFDEVFAPLRREVETLQILHSGKAVSSPFYSRPDALQTTTVSTKQSLAPKKSYGSLPPPIPSSHPTSPLLDYSSKPTRTISNMSTSSYNRPSPTLSQASFRSQSDYLSQPTGPGARRQSSNGGPTSPLSPSGFSHAGISPAGSSVSLASAAAAAVAKKKKPPPPPPPKRKPSSNPPLDYVTALYDFPGEGEGDLAFREGDKIRVLKRTQSEQDWWEGECRGMRGSFPANYCRA